MMVLIKSTSRCSCEDSRKCVCMEHRAIFLLIIRSLIKHDGIHYCYMIRMEPESAGEKLRNPSNASVWAGGGRPQYLPVLLKVNSCKYVVFLNVIYLRMWGVMLESLFIWCAMISLSSGITPTHLLTELHNNTITSWGQGGLHSIWRNHLYLCCKSTWSRRKIAVF